MMTASGREKLKKAAYGALAAIFWIAVWYAAACIVSKELLVASPLTVVRRILKLGAASSFWEQVGFSLVRMLAGWALGVAGGVLLAVAGHRLSLVYALSSPMLTAIRATPVASFILLAIVWFRVGQVPSFIAFLMVLPIVWGNVTSGLRTVSARSLEVARVFSFGARKRLRYIWLPTLAPYLASSLTASLGLAWKAGIAAEVLCRPEQSIGSQLYDSKIYLDTPDLFAWTLVVILISLILERLLKLALGALSPERRATK